MVYVYLKRGLQSVFSITVRKQGDTKELTNITELTRLISYDTDQNCEAVQEVNN